MTATPIPRTIAMTVFGDLDMSSLTELPLGRSPIQTSVVPTTDHPAWLDRAWQRVAEEVRQGRQAYVVCPRIDSVEEEDEPIEYGKLRLVYDRDAERRAELDALAKPRKMVALLDVLPELRQREELRGLRIEAMHGRLPPEEKDAIMQAFTAGQIDVLVATTVIEVGVDVANATVMVVMDADRFGVSQLHQLRGRVGRGEHPGLCLFVTPVTAELPAAKRLMAVAATDDGSVVSRIDLEYRQEGDVLGAAQSGGTTALKYLSVLRDEDLIVAARDEAAGIVRDDPDLTTVPGLRELVRALESDASSFMQKT